MLAQGNTAKHRIKTWAQDSLVISKVLILDLCVHVYESLIPSVYQLLCSLFLIMMCHARMNILVHASLSSSLFSSINFQKAKLLASMWNVLITKLPFIKFESIYIFISNFENSTLSIFLPLMTLKNDNLLVKKS